MADNNWQTDTLANICDSIDYGLTESAKTLPAGPKFLRITDIVNGHIDWATVPYCEVAEEEIEKYKIHHGDIVIARTGATTGYSIYVKNPPNAVFASYLVRYKVKKEFDGQFVSYFLKSPDYWEYIRGVLGDKSAQPNASASTIAQVKVNYPSLPEQRAIAEILGVLDDKVELNRRMNRTLESMARAVFRELMKEERGKETTIGEVVTIVGGSTPSTANSAFWEDGDIHWATPKDLAPLQSPVLLETNSRITELGLQQISSGLLPAGTVLLSSRAPIGYLAITQIPIAINQGFIAIKCTDEVPNYFILNWLKDNMEEIIGRANGTTFLEISKSNFRPMKINVPSPEKMNMFVETVQPLYQKIVANLKESRTLASLRDSLLPKMMRGEVRVKS